MLKTTRKCVNYTSEKYPVYHARQDDYTCDLHIIATTLDNNDQILIPVDKKKMMENLPYFENMFKSESNWEENKMSDGDSGEIPSITIEVSRPTLLGDYIKSMYTGELEITDEDCVDFHYIADYFQDNILLQDIVLFIRRNITFENSIQLINNDYSDKFEDEITRFFSETKLKNFDEFLIKLNDMIMEKFIRMVKILNKVKDFSSANYIKIIMSWMKNYQNFGNIIESSFLYEIDFQKTEIKHRLIFFNYYFENIAVSTPSISTKEDDFRKMYEHIVGKVNEDIYECINGYSDKDNYESDDKQENTTANSVNFSSSSYLKKLKKIENSARCTDENIQIYVEEKYDSCDGPVLKITTEDAKRISWKSMILPVRGITSFKVINMTKKFIGHIGVTEHRKILPDGHLLHWKKSVSSNSINGSITDYLDEDYVHDGLCPWASKHDSIIFDISSSWVIIEINSKNPLRSPNQTYKVSKSATTGKLYPAISIGVANAEIIMTDIEFE